jgi:hypothetical protein
MAPLRDTTAAYPQYTFLNVIVKTTFLKPFDVDFVVPIVAGQKLKVPFRTFWWK